LRPEANGWKIWLLQPLGPANGSLIAQSFLLAPANELVGEWEEEEKRKIRLLSISMPRAAAERC